MKNAMKEILETIKIIGPVVIVLGLIWIFLARPYLNPGQPFDALTYVVAGAITLLYVATAIFPKTWQRVKDALARAYDTDTPAEKLARAIRARLEEEKREPK